VASRRRRPSRRRRQLGRSNSSGSARPNRPAAPRHSAIDLSWGFFNTDPTRRPLRFLNRNCGKQMAAMCLIVLSIVFDWHVSGYHMAGVAGVVFFTVRALPALFAALTVPTQKHDVATRQRDANGADHERSRQKRCDFCADDRYLNRNQKRMQCIREDPIYGLLERFDVRKRMRKLRARNTARPNKRTLGPAHRCERRSTRIPKPGRTASGSIRIGPISRKTHTERMSLQLRSRGPFELRPLISIGLPRVHA
jgi:hypothetical protein